MFLSVSSLVQGQEHLGGDGAEVSAGLTAHSHDVLEAVEARAAGAVDRLAVVCWERFINIQLGLYLKHQFSRTESFFSFFCSPLTLTGTTKSEASFPSLSPSRGNFFICTTRFPKTQKSV